MRVTLTITTGPNAGRQFVFDGHDTFLVGRSKHAHYQTPPDDRFFSRVHFLLEVNPPRCRLMDLGSRNGTQVNGARVSETDLHDGDEIRAGRTVFQVHSDATQPAADSTGSDRAVEAAPVRVGPYTVLRELGRGGMGVVYLAHRAGHAEPAALKVIRPSESTTRAQVDRFLREADILRQVDHPRVVRYIDSGEAGDWLYLAMEYVSGENSSAWVRGRGVMDFAQAAALTGDLLDGLAHAHDLGFVHRDVKPSNVLLTASAVGAISAKLTDFGLARVYDSSHVSGLSLAGEIGGTPCFMAPEQITDYRNVSHPADQYAAAATAYYWLTGKDPLEVMKQPIAAVLAAVLEEEPAPLSYHRPDAPAGLVQALQRALAKEPTMRFADCRAFRRALGGV